MKMVKDEYKTEKTEYGEKSSHPSYGTLMFNRSTGAQTALFGSSIEHRDTIVMEVRHADLTREFHGDSIFGDKLMLRAEMSYSQFAEAITSFGMGSGVPVTIRWTEKDGKIPECNYVSKREQFVEEFKGKREKAVEGSQQLIQDIYELFEKKKNLTKSDRQEVMSKLQQLSNGIGTNMDFVAKQFNEQMDKTIREAKGEIESFCQNKINSIASAALVEKRDEIKKMEGPVNLLD